MRVPPVENLMCAAFEKYEEVPEMVLLELSEDDVTWVASKLSGAAEDLGAEAIELRNWLLRFRFVSEELRVIVADLVDWTDKPTPSPPMGFLPCSDVMSPCCNG